MAGGLKAIAADAARVGAFGRAVRVADDRRLRIFNLAISFDRFVLPERIPLPSPAVATGGVCACVGHGASRGFRPTAESRPVISAVRDPMLVQIVEKITSQVENGLASLRVFWATSQASILGLRGRLLPQDGISFEIRIPSTLIDRDRHFCGSRSRGRKPKVFLYCVQLRSVN